MTDLLVDRHADGLDRLVASAAFGHVPAEQLGISVLGNPEQPDLAVIDGLIWVAPDAHMTFGAAVMIRRSRGIPRLSSAHDRH